LFFYIYIYITKITLAKYFLTRNVVQSNTVK